MSTEIESIPKLSPYGMLLAFDGYAAPADVCRDKELLRCFLERMPEYIGMRPIGKPHIVEILEEGIQGLSGFIFIMESHISVHTYEERGFVTADVYSCKRFDAEDAAAYIAFAFGIHTYDTNMLERGLRFNESTIDTKRIGSASGP